MPRGSCFFWLVFLLTGSSFGSINYDRSWLPVFSSPPPGTENKCRPGYWFFPSYQFPSLRAGECGASLSGELSLAEFPESGPEPRCSCPLLGRCTGRSCLLATVSCAGIGWAFSRRHSSMKYDVMVALCPLRQFQPPECGVVMKPPDVSGLHHRYEHRAPLKLIVALLTGRIRCPIRNSIGKCPPNLSHVATHNSFSKESPIRLSIENSYFLRRSWALTKQYSPWMGFSVGVGCLRKQLLLRRL